MLPTPRADAANPPDARSASGAVASARTLRIGTVPGPHAEILGEVKRVAAQRGLALDVVVIDTPSRIDQALAAGRIDVASFEDERQLDATRRRHRLAIASVAATVTLPMALYSRRLKHLSELPPRATVSIPADRAGMARALVLLQNETFLTLRDQAGLDATLRDVTANRLGLRLVARPADRLFDALETSDLVAMARDTAARSKLQPARDSIGIEDARSPYADVLAVRDADRSQAWVRELVAAYHSDDVAHFILVRYQDSVRRPW
ncbi:MAG: MetQ/NlpA family lipoprotein [Burkholderia gladioli]